MPEVSIIVPIYNIQAYISDCLDSILAQTFQSYEVIMVDDGSTDSSCEVCQAYLEKDDRFRLLRQQNQGLSGARNSGIAHARGKYVVCIDGDDIVSPVYIEALHHAITQSGCSMAAMRRGISFFDGDAQYLEQNSEMACAFRVLSEMEYQEELLYQKSGNGAPWRMCTIDIAREYLYPMGLVYEDLATTYKMVHACGNVAVLDSIGLYGYRQRRDGIMRRGCNEINVISCMRITDSLSRDISTWYPTLQVAVSSRCFSVCRSVFAGLPSESVDARETIWDALRCYAPTVVRDKHARKRERIAALFAIAGRRPFGLFCSLYRRYKKNN